MHERTKSVQDSEKLLASFLEFESLGLRAKAKTAALAIVETLRSLEAKDAWTRANLQKLPLNGQSRIRHEIYDGIVFPALKARYEQNDPEAFYLLGKTWQNFISQDAYIVQLGYHSSKSFFERAYRADPNSNRYQQALLEALIGEFDDLFHEWPSGILIDHENWADELSDLLAEIELARSLDKNGQYAEETRSFLERTKLYTARLTNRGPHH